GSLRDAGPRAARLDRSVDLTGCVSAPQDPAADYAVRLQTWRTRIAALDRRHLLLSNSRLVVAAAGAIVLWLAFIRASISAWWPVGAGLAFAALAIVHARVLLRTERARRAEAWYVRGIDRLAGRWIGRGRGGARFVDDHPYARDPGLFGGRSRRSRRFAGGTTRSPSSGRRRSFARTSRCWRPRAR